MVGLSVSDFPQELRRAYDVVCPLSNGSFGEVFKAKTRSPKLAGFPEQVAIQVLRVPGDRVTRQLQMELSQHVKCFYPHVVAVLDVVVLPMRIAVVSELVPGGSMFDLVRNSRHGLPEDKVRWIFQQVILGVFYLHSLGIAQKNINLDNLLVLDASANWPTVKIMAFDYSKDSRMRSSEYQMGTAAYMAPEILQGSDRMYDRMKADMWSCGMMLYAMLFCRHPFQIAPTDEALPEGELQKLMMGGFELPTHRKISLQCQDLLRHLMTVDPDERFSAEKCLCHPWFQKNLPPTAIEEAHKYLTRTEERWSSGRRRAFEKKMRQRSDGSRALGCWGKSRPEA